VRAATRLEEEEEGGGRGGGGGDEEGNRVEMCNIFFTLLCAPYMKFSK
jgi:hypothetical protein